MNRDQIKGKWDQLVGSAKQHWGSLTDDDVLRAEGSAEKLYGIIQERFGDTKEFIQDKLSLVQKKLRGADDGQLERVNYADVRTGSAPIGPAQPSRSSSGLLDHRIDPSKADAVQVGSDPAWDEEVSDEQLDMGPSGTKGGSKSKGGSKAKATAGKAKATAGKAKATAGKAKSTDESDASQASADSKTSESTPGQRRSVTTANKADHIDGPRTPTGRSDRPTPSR